MMTVSNCGLTAHVIAPHCHMNGPKRWCVGAGLNLTASLNVAGSMEWRYSWSSPMNVKSATSLRASASTTALR